MSPFDLVIFDCDGVLIDSERLAVRTEVTILDALGWPLSESEIIDRFVGRSAAHMQREVENHIGRPIDWAKEFDAVYREVFMRELQPVDGVIAALDQITQPTCVASSGTPEMLRFTLGLTGLYERFEGRIYSALEVEHGKPAPDLFLHAARCMNTGPEGCAVIEDSRSGVLAGLAAGMRVFAFAGGVTDRSALAEPGVTVFDEMELLPALLGL